MFETFCQFANVSVELGTVIWIFSLMEFVQNMIISSDFIVIYKICTVRLIRSINLINRSKTILTCILSFRLHNYFYFSLDKIENFNSNIITLSLHTKWLANVSVYFNSEHFLFRAHNDRFSFMKSHIAQSKKKNLKSYQTDFAHFNFDPAREHTILHCKNNYKIVRKITYSICKIKSWLNGGSSSHEGLSEVKWGEVRKWGQRWMGFCLLRLGIGVQTFWFGMSFNGIVIRVGFGCWLLS